MALERLQSVFNDIYQNEARSTDDMPSPSIDEIGDDHFYSSGFFDSINQILQPKVLQTAMDLHDTCLGLSRLVSSRLVSVCLSVCLSVCTC